MPRHPTQIVIMDIDGTLANTQHRVHLIPKAGYGQAHNPDASWQAFFAASVDDTPHPEIVALNNAMDAAGYGVFVVTGRSEDDRERTEAWLLKHRIWHDRLYMRPAGDRRQDTVVKAEILARIRAEGAEPLFAVEDRASVTAMWRENGVRCLQVCEGAY